MSLACKEYLKLELDKLLEGYIIEDAESPWAAPVVLVSKKRRGIRICMEYQSLNAVIVSDSYLLPRMDD